MKSLLIHTCTIKKATLGTANTYGEYGSPSYTDTEGVPCRFYRPSGYMSRTDQAELTTSDCKILFSKDVDIIEGNLAEGTSGFTGTYTIRKVIPRYNGSILHHYECEVDGEK